MIDDLLAQLSFAPTVRRASAYRKPHVLVGGMGGSALSGDALAHLLPERAITVHRDYGLPKGIAPDTEAIAISHSGNTEETLSFANAALAAGLPLSVISAGGTLATFADRENLPYAQVPTGLQPRYALIHLVRAGLSLMEETDALARLAALSLCPEELTAQAEQDAHFILPSVPLFYASGRTAGLARTAKNMLNETGRTPSFVGIFPELNHNEMQAFDRDMPEGLSQLFRFIILRDARDGARINARMDAFGSLMKDRGRMIEVIDLSDLSLEESLVSVWIRFTLAARMLGEARGVAIDTVPLVEEFKRMI